MWNSSPGGQTWKDPTNRRVFDFDARLLCLLLEVDDGYRFLPALGTYRRELARFHSHMLSFVDPEHVGLVLRAGAHAWRLARVGPVALCRAGLKN